MKSFLGTGIVKARRKAYHMQETQKSILRHWRKIDLIFNTPTSFFSQFPASSITLTWRFAAFSRKKKDLNLLPSSFESRFDSPASAFLYQSVDSHVFIFVSLNLFTQDMVVFDD
ncbi:hypothetical protein YC2023_057799 [Brassica napus]